eukprot:jgi/Picsp_1/2684/NSC_00914-R1_rna-binding protein 45
MIMVSFSLDDPPNSRLFVVAGRNTSSEFLRSVFEKYGRVSFVKYLRDKGVAYVKYEKASSAAFAIENLHEATLNDGQGPRLKVMLAESPHARGIPSIQKKYYDDVLPADPDNLPPRSRLFMVVPKNADGSLIEAEMASYPGMQYCKIDLIGAKGIVFVKYETSSAACAAMEAIQSSGVVAGYRVKIMLAEPKTRRQGGVELFKNFPKIDSPVNSFLPQQIAFDGAGMMLGRNQNFGGSNTISQTANLNAGFAQGLTSLVDELTQDNHFLGSSLGEKERSVKLHAKQAHALSSGLSNMSFDLSDSMHSSTMGDNQTSLFPTVSGHKVDLNSVPPGNRLFVVVHKGVNEETLSSVFRCYSGMEYLDLKRDRSSGRSKGYAYVNYHNIESAKAAQLQLNGIEFPQGSGCQLKVLFAAPPGIPGIRLGDQNSLSVSSANSEHQFQSSPAKGFLGTPSQDTAATNFQLPSPNSGDSVSQFCYGTQYLQQNSARTDLSSASHESLVSPLSSPLDKAKMHGDQEFDFKKVQESLADLKLDFGFFDRDDMNRFPSRNAGAISNESPKGDMGDCIASCVGPCLIMENDKDDKIVYSSFEEPLDAISIHQIFTTCGKVESIEYTEDGKTARVKFADEDSVVTSLGILNGSTTATGLKITVTHSLPN